jgi:hypothetical protein
MQEHDLDRPALRPAVIAEYAPGRQRLSPRWWADADLEPGTTLLAREECRRRRAAKPPKRNPDIVAQKEARGYANWCWQFAPECLAWELSSALH